MSCSFLHAHTPFPSFIPTYILGFFNTTLPLSINPSFSILSFSPSRSVLPASVSWVSPLYSALCLQLFSVEFPLWSLPHPLLFFFPFSWHNFLSRSATLSARLLVSAFFFHHWLNIRSPFPASSMLFFFPSGSSLISFDFPASFPVWIPSSDFRTYNQWLPFPVSLTWGVPVSFHLAHMSSLFPPPFHPHTFCASPPPAAHVNLALFTFLSCPFFLLSSSISTF